MENILIIIIVILAYLVYNAKSEAKSEPGNTTPKPEHLEQALPYQKKYLFTKTEYKFYMCLILCAIELDGPSHYNKKSQETDTFKNKLFETIKIPLYRVKTDTDYNAVIENIIKSIKTTNPEAQDAALQNN